MSHRPLSNRGLTGEKTRVLAGGHTICTVNGYMRREDEYTISIPAEYVEAARAKLAAEVSLTP